MSHSKIPSIMVTLLRLGRIHVITKETMTDFYKGKMSDGKQSSVDTGFTPCPCPSPRHVFRKKVVSMSTPRFKKSRVQKIVRALKFGSPFVVFQGILVAGKDSWEKREVGKSDMKLERMQLKSSRRSWNIRTEAGKYN